MKDTANGVEEVNELLDDFLNDDVATAWKEQVAAMRRRYKNGTNIKYDIINPAPPETD